MTDTSLTMPATLQLATPQALREALKLLGFEWTPTPYSGIPKTVVGLYAWVIDPGGESDLLAAPLIYVGIGASKDGGLRRRLSSEIGGVNLARTDHDDWSYIHPRAIARLNGKPVGGTVQRTAVRDLTWLNDVRKRLADEDHRSTAEWRFSRLERWLDGTEPTDLEKAERLCVRAAAWLGDCAPPVNSQFASAWPKVADSYEWGGWAAARHLLASAQPPAGLEAVTQSAM